MTCDMRPESRARLSRARLSRPRAVGALLALALAPAVAGCGSVVAASSSISSSVSSAQQLAARGRLLHAMAVRVGHSRLATFQATYAVPGSGSLTVVQSPPASAFISRAGRLITTGRFVYLCDAGRGRSTCQRTSTAAAGTPNPSTALGVTGFLSGDLAVGVLSAAMLVPKVTVTTSTPKIAGQATTCLTVSGLDKALHALATRAAGSTAGSTTGAPDGSPASNEPSTLTLCVTGSGVLARFTGSLGSGRSADMVLTRYATTVNAGLLRPPRGAKITG